MKRYLFFQTPDSGFDLDSPQFILCGNPRIAVLNPVSNALSFLWEQIEPDPLIAAVTFVPNNTSKNVTVTIPNAIVNDIVLKITLNGDVNNFRLIKIVVNLIDTAKDFSSGTGSSISTNTLQDPLPITLVPFPSTGSQVIRYTNNSQTTGVSFSTQIYRQTYVDSIKLYTNNNTFIQDIDVFRTLYEKLLNKDERVNLNVNTPYNVLKQWADIKVLSEQLIPNSQTINIPYPTFIADEYITSTSSGTGLAIFLRTPFLTQNQFLEDSLPNNFSSGTGLAVFLRDPFTLQNQSLQDSLPNNFTSGTGLAVFLRTPFSSNIIG